MTNVEFRALRTRAGATQARVAIRATVDRTRLCMWELGDLTLQPNEVRSLEKALDGLIGEQAEQMANLLRESRQVSNPYGRQVKAASERGSLAEAR
jgi:DNA-binding XRE family transcriptional regulator